jgi:Sushi repeat (SCR repeat)
VEIEKIYQIYEEYARSKMDLKSCPYIYPKYFYGFQIQKERRLHSIRLRTTHDDWYRLQNKDLTFQGRKNDQSKWENFNLDIGTSNELVFPSNPVLIDHSNSGHFKNIRLTPNTGAYICEIILFAYHDECGHPEVPLHGHVQFEPGEAKAIYRCDDGYQLESNCSNRHCIQGRWNGSQPICTK